MGNHNGATYTFEYSADYSKQAEEIVNKYVNQEKDALTKMKELDAQITKKATIPAILMGIVGTLILGGGMSLVMEVGGVYLWFGIAIGILGITICGSAFTFYQNKIKKERAKVASEIVKLSKEVSRG